MRVVTTARALMRYAGYILSGMLFLSVFIVPFLVFGTPLESFARTALESERADFAAAAVAFVLLAGDPFLPTPSSVIATLLAARIGFVGGAMVNAAALSVACILGYALGRVGGWAMSRTGRRLPRGFSDWVGRHGLIAVLLCRPVPVLAEASLVIAGAAGHPARRLLLWCCAVQSVLGIAYAFAGSGWGRGDWDEVAVMAGSVGVPLLGAIVVILASRWENGKQVATDQPRP